jgi:hypothetical protein
MMKGISGLILASSPIRDPGSLKAFGLQDFARAARPLALPVRFRPDTELEAPRGLARFAAWVPLLILVLTGSATSPARADGDYVPGQVLVRYREGVTERARSAAESAVQARRIRSFTLAPIHLLELDTGADVEQASARLRSDPAVAYAEPNYRIHAALVPNDPLFAQQVGLRNTGQSGGVAGADVHALQAWDTYTGDRNVRVAVLDTGIDVGHPDLADNIWINEDELRGEMGSDDEVNGYVDDINGYNFIDGNGNVSDNTGHGTQVAGVIGAAGNNGVGITGLNWQCRLVAVKVMRTPNDGSVATAVDGLQYVVASRIRIANSAWTLTTYSQSLLDAIDAAGHAGVLFVTAAGNNGLDLDATPRYPASYDSPYILDVAASDASDELAPFSNYGATAVDIAAPGVSVVTTQAGGIYYAFSGTSIAAAMVAGTCALALGRFPYLTNLELKDLVIRTAEERPGLLGMVRTNGRLNTASSIADPDLAPPATIADLVVAAPGSNSIELSWTAPGDDGTHGTADHYEFRYSTSPIVPANFASATLVPTRPPSVAGTIEHADVRGLAISTPYYFAVRAIDESDNLAPISNVAPGTTLGAPSIEVTPPSIGTALVTGGSTTESFQIANPTQGTLDFEMPTPQLQGLTRENPYERALAKGEPDGAPGAPLIESAGGPDAFGYLWSDNDAPYGPGFRWVDLTALGPPVALSGDDTATVAIPMGIRFPFYGTVFDRVSIATNGYLTFTPWPVVFDNHAFPTSSGTPNMVAALWDDFDFGTTHRVYARHIDDRFVVSWVGVSRAAGTAGTYTFQAILYPTGEIRFQYLALGSVRNSAAIGIQDQSRNVGLGIVNNAAYVRDSLAIRIRPVTQWLSVSPDSGRVRAGESATIEAIFDAVDLPQGGLHAQIQIQSNDPVRPLVSLPVHLYVIGAPDIDLSPTAIDLDTVIVGVPVTRTVSVLNRGRLPLRVKSVATGDPSLSATAGPFDVQPGETKLITLRYAPSGAGTLHSTLSVYSNDPDAGHRVVDVAATALMPAILAVEPESLVVDLFTNADTTRTLRVANHGGSTLRFLTQVAYADAAPGLASTESAAPRRVDPQRSGGPDVFGYTFADSDVPGGPVFDWIDVRTTGTLLDMIGDDANTGPFPIGFGFPFYGSNYSLFRVSTNGFMSLTSASTMYINLPLPSVDAPSNLIAPFWDDLAFSGDRSVYVQHDSTKLVVEYVNVPRWGETATNTFEVILHRDGRMVFQYQTIAANDPDSCTVGIQDGAGEGGLQVAYNETYVRSGLAVRIQPPRQFLSVAPIQGVLAPGDSIDLTVRFDASGLLEGDYLAAIQFDSNDLARPRLDVPVRLRVHGSALAAVSPDSLVFGTVYVGHPRILGLNLQNIGTARLQVTSIVPSSPGYRVSASTLSLAPSEQAAIQVTLDPAAPGNFDATLLLTTNDPSQPTISVPMTGTALLAPEIVVTPDSLFAAAATPQNPSERVVTKQVVVENRGGSDLEWSASTRSIQTSATVAESRALASAPLDVQPAKDAIDAPGDPVLAASGGPDAFGYKWIDSNQPGGPEFDWIDISTTGTRVTLSRDDQISAPIALPFPFEFYGATFDSVRVCSNGWLSFTNRDSTYANVRLPNSGHRTPENLVAPFWDDIDLRRNGRIYAQGDTNRFVISFLEVAHWVEPGASTTSVYTFEAILSPNGDIDFQYLAMVGTINSGTIGIQDSSRTIALPIAFNTTYVQDGLRIRISRLLDWFTTTPRSGVVAAGERDTIDVRFDATELANGDYRGVLEITSNDPAHALISIPVLLRVGTGGPDLTAGGNAPPVTTTDALPRVFSFALAGPHPARGIARFELALPERCPVELAVFDVRGARVRRVAYGELPAGWHPLEWDGATGGRRAGPGVYFVRVLAGRWQATRRVALVR